MSTLDQHRFRAAAHITPGDIVGARIGQALQERRWSGEDLRLRLKPYLGESWEWPAALLALAIVFEKPLGWFLEPADPNQEVEFPSGKKVRGEVVAGPILGGNTTHVVYGDGGQIEELTLRF